MWFFKRRQLQLAIPDPCREDWEEMDGTEQARFCGTCQHTVHDFSAMTRREAVRVIEASKGKLCGKIVRNQRGSLIFRADPDSGRLARIFSVSLAGLAATPAVTTAQTSGCQVTVRATDLTAAAVPGASVTATSLSHPVPIIGETDSTGSAKLALAPDKYQIRIQSPGFVSHEFAKVECTADEQAELNAELRVGSMGAIVLVDVNAPHQRWSWLKYKFSRFFNRN